MTSTSKQEMNKIFEDPFKGRAVMVNYCSRQAVVDFPEMKEVYHIVYDSYEPDVTQIAELVPFSGGVEITIVLGTWCGDSKMQVPRFFRVIDALGISDQNLTLICTDGEKKAENGLLDHLDIVKVPTFIFYLQEKELGRIIESPQTTLENEMLNILKK
jgi:hypothetical protein